MLLHLYHKSIKLKAGLFYIYIKFLKQITMKKLVLFIFTACFLFSCGHDKKLSSKSFSNGDILIPFQIKEGKKWGFMNIDGEVILNPQFKYAPSYAVRNIALIKEDGEKEGESIYRFIKIKNNKYEVSKEKWDMAGMFKDGLAPVRNRSQKVKFINEEFETIFTVNAEKASSFNDGLAAICDKYNKWGFIDKNGKEVINPQFDQIVYGFRDGFAIVANEKDDGNYFMIIDKSGNIKLDLKQKYESVISFSEGLVKVLDHGEYGFINLDGKRVIKMDDERDYISDFYNGYASFREGQEWGLIDVSGKEIFNANYDNPLYVSNGKIWYNEDDEWGVMDMKGNDIIDPSFDGQEPYPFMSGRTLVQDKGDFFFIDSKGEDVSLDQYYNVHAFDRKYIDESPWNSTFNSDYFNVKSVQKLIPDNLLQIKTPDQLAKTFDLNPLLFFSDSPKDSYAGFREDGGKYRLTDQNSFSYNFTTHEYDYSNDYATQWESISEVMEEQAFSGDEYYEDEYYEDESATTIKSKYPLDAPISVKSISYSFEFNDVLGITKSHSDWEAASNDKFGLNKLARVQKIAINVTLDKSGSGKAILLAKALKNSWLSKIKKVRSNTEDNTFFFLGKLKGGEIKIQTDASSLEIIISYN